MTVPHPATRTEEELLRECDLTRQRRSGPGGQHRNKVETAIRLTHRPTGCSAQASERRSQAANLAMAVRRLRLNLALEHRRQTSGRPSELWKSRCRAGMIAINTNHEDFPSLLAEALDVLAEENWEGAAAATHLRCTLSQLVKLLRKEPRALALLNDQRSALGLLRLR